MKATFSTILAAAANAINAQRARSTWDKAVKADALDFLDKLNEWNEYKAIDIATLCDRGAVRELLLNGADDFQQYSWGGCALIYDDDIKANYLTPSEQRKYKGNTIHGANVLDIQARALSQAANIVTRYVSIAARDALNE